MLMLKLFDNMDIGWQLMALKLGSVDRRAYMDGGFEKKNWRLQSWLPISFSADIYGY